MLLMERTLLRTSFYSIWTPLTILQVFVTNNRFVCVYYIITSLISTNWIPRTRDSIMLEYFVIIDPSRIRKLADIRKPCFFAARAFSLNIVITNMRRQEQLICTRTMKNRSTTVWTVDSLIYKNPSKKSKRQQQDPCKPSTQVHSVYPQANCPTRPAVEDLPPR